MSDWKAYPSDLTDAEWGIMEPKPKTTSSSGGFHVQPRRWVIERTFGWITRWCRLARDHEGLPSSSEAFIKLSESIRRLSHLAPAFPATMLS